MNYSEPTSASIQGLLEVIFGDGVVATPCEDTFGAQHYLASYVDPDSTLVALSACDEHFVVYSSAALSMVPAAVANEAAASGDITDTMQANFYEVMNICSKLMLEDGGPHLRLDQVTKPGDGTDKIAALKESATLLGFQIQVPGYGDGKLLFLVT